MSNEVLGLQFVIVDEEILAYFFANKPEVSGSLNR